MVRVRVGIRGWDKVKSPPKWLLGPLYTRLELLKTTHFDFFPLVCICISIYIYRGVGNCCDCR